MLLELFICDDDDGDDELLHVLVVVMSFEEVEAEASVTVERSPSLTNVCNK